MRLADYIKREGLTFEQFAHRIYEAAKHDTTAETVRQIARETRFPRRDLGVAIVRTTGGEVTWEDLYPRPADLDEQRARGQPASPPATTGDRGRSTVASRHRMRGAHADE